MIRSMALSAAMASVALAGCNRNSAPPTNQVCAEAPPVQRIPEFEDSTFCRKYHCRLGKPACVAGLDRRVDRWDYKYRLEGNDLMDVELPLSTNGERKEPYMLVNWRPLKPAEKEGSTAGFTITTNAVPDKEMAPVRDLVNEIVGSKEFDAYTYAEKCFLSFTRGEHSVDGVLAKRYSFACTYYESNDQKRPQQRMYPKLSPGDWQASHAAEATIDVSFALSGDWLLPDCASPPTILNRGFPEEDLWLARLSVAQISGLPVTGPEPRTEVGNAGMLLSPTASLPKIGGGHSRRPIPHQN